MAKEETLKSKMETFLKLNDDLQLLNKVIEAEKKNEKEKYLSKFRFFDANAQFTTREQYLMDKCGNDPLEQLSNYHKNPGKSPKIPAPLIVWALIAFAGIILTIVSFINIFTSNGNIPSIEVILAIVGGIGALITWGDYSTKKDNYNQSLNEYNRQEHYNNQLREQHIEWKKSIELATTQYEEEKAQFTASQKKTKKEFEQANKKYNEATKLIDDKFDDEYTPLLLRVCSLDDELVRAIKKADDKIPSSKKYGLDIFSEDVDEYIQDDSEPDEDFGLTLDDFMQISSTKLIPVLALYLKDNDLIEALLRYYKEAHHEKMEEEQLRLEEERNELERERIRTYKEQEEENRRQQEKFKRNQEKREREMERERRQQENQRAKQEADWAAARIRCSKCKLYNNCRSSSKNKSPTAFCFKPQN